jgi:hypothetical protein
MAETDPSADPMSGTLADVMALIVRLRKAVKDDPEPIKEALVALAKGDSGPAVREHIEGLKSEELLPVQWELEEVLEATAPAKPEPEVVPEPEAEPEALDEEEDPNRPLTSADLNLVYDDPRGLMLHKTKTGDRWFATQTNPNTQQPQTFELQAQEIAQLQQQLAGSPYWLVGA